jgi:HD superfamily phosphodiesterase
MNNINQLYQFVIQISNEFNIDESHALKHSMDVFYHAIDIFEHELNLFNFKNNDEYIQIKNIISLSAILHDMCDNKYMNEDSGWNKINQLLIHFNIHNDSIQMIKHIIFNMSYSKVKKNGYPSTFFNDHHKFAYHIVREADLITSYDFDRCVIFGMYKTNLNYHESFNESLNIFDDRVLKYIHNKLFITNYSKNYAQHLHSNALIKIKNLKKYIYNNINDL